jgi:hypothetical protein
VPGAARSSQLFLQFHTSVASGQFYSADFFAGEPQSDCVFDMKFLLKMMLSPRIPAITGGKTRRMRPNNFVTLI